MTAGERIGREGIGKSRLEALSDGIFAFAMTLLVISLAVPVIPRSEAPEILPSRMIGMIPEFIIFVIAFFILAGYWLAHHRILRTVEYVDEALIWINILLLFFVVLIPFSTSISGDYDNVLLAVLTFHLNLLIASLLLSLLWWYIRRHPDITGLKPGLAREAQEMNRRRAIIPLVCILAIIISFISPGRSMMCYLLIPLVSLAFSAIARHRRPA